MTEPLTPTAWRDLMLPGFRALEGNIISFPELWHDRFCAQKSTIDTATSAGMVLDEVDFLMNLWDECLEAVFRFENRRFKLVFVFPGNDLLKITGPDQMPRKVDAI